MPLAIPRLIRWSPRYLLLAGLVTLSLGAPGDDSCTMSAGGDGLCIGLSLGPRDPMLRVGESLQILVNAGGCTAADECSCATTVAENSRWRSADPKTATVDAAGVVTVIGPGKALVQLVPADGGAPLSMVVTVVQSAVGRSGE
jgi:hypothetical protein